MVALQVLVLSVEVRIPVLQLSLQESASVGPRCSPFFVQISGSVTVSGDTPWSNTDIREFFYRY